MAFQNSTIELSEQRIFTWASVGLLVFVSAFLWAPSRDGLQGVYVLAFFVPMLKILLFRKPNFNEYGGWPTVIALIYAGFSALSTLWGEPKDFGFFGLQWCVLATWLCGSCLVFSKREIDMEKYLRWLVMFGVLITLLTFIYNFLFIDSNFPMQMRLVGWNVFRNPNEIGAFCGIIALLAFTIAVQSLSLKQTWLFYILALIATAGLLASLSRAAFLALTIMSLIALLIVRPPLKIWLPPVLIAIVIVLILLGTTDILTSFTGGRGDGLGPRLNIWKEVFERWQKHIFIGVGMTKDTNIIALDASASSHAHNAWLDTLYRTGLIGFIIVLSHLIKVVQRFSSNQSLLSLYLWLGYGCICNLVDGRCFFWEIGAKWFLYWIPIGLIVAVQTGVIVRALKLDLKVNAY